VDHDRAVTDGLSIADTTHAYIRRVVDDELDDLTPHLPAISIEGAKGVGKTRTALRRAETVHRLDDDAVATIVRADPRRAVAGDPPVLLDEWQRVPELWDLVRRAVDDDPSGGRFLLTGSSSARETATHSGAGRIVAVRMRPLSLTERGIDTPTVSIGELLTGRRGEITGSTSVTLSTYAEHIVRSGLPGLAHLSGRARRAQLDGYLQRIVEHDVDEAGLRVRRPDTLRRWLTAYAAATATTASYEKIRDAATSGIGDKPARTTTGSYVEVLERLWILDRVDPWKPAGTHLSRLSAPPKHHLVDPALAARLLGVGVDALLDGRDVGPTVPRDGPLAGALFESFVTQSVRVYAQAAEARIRHLRTYGGDREIDLIVERDDARVLALDVKLARTVANDDVRHLTWLREQLGDDLLDAVIVTTGPDAYRRTDGIAVVPAALLGP
jgi:predicted AAA+ superfamily ATPase